jgi:hypothetical protein
MESCKNCGKELLGAYCYQCGQKARTARISWKYLLGELLHFFTHLEKGFFHTGIQMLMNPGALVIRFLEGKRKEYQPPVSYFLVWTAIFILLLLAMEFVFGKNQVILYNDYYGPGRSTEYAIRHLTYILIAIFPFISVYFWIFAANFKYNYFESLITVFYVIGTILLLQCVFVIMAIVIHLITNKSVNLLYSDSLKILFVSWFAYSFLKLFPVKHKLIRGIVFVLLSFGSFTFWRIVVYPWLAALIIGYE